MILNASGAVYAQSAMSKNYYLPEIQVDQKIGDKLPLDLVLTDETGKQVQLSSFFSGKPVILTPVYYTCPMLCNLVLNGLVKSLKELSFNPGEDYEIVTFSFKPEDTPEIAKAKKQTYLKEYSREGAEKGWHFLTGSQETIKALTESIGFNYYFDERTGEYAHAAMVVIATPEGKISHYLFGVHFSLKDMRLALIEASKNKLGTFYDQIMLLCYHYDPSTGKYGFAVMNALRVAGFLTVAALAIFITVSLRKERHREVYK